MRNLNFMGKENAHRRMFTCLVIGEYWTNEDGSGVINTHKGLCSFDNSDELDLACLEMLSFLGLER